MFGHLSCLHVYIFFHINRHNGKRGGRDVWFASWRKYRGSLRFSFDNSDWFPPPRLLKYVYIIDYLENVKVVYKKSSMLKIKLLVIPLPRDFFTSLILQSNLVPFGYLYKLYLVLCLAFFSNIVLKKNLSIKYYPKYSLQWLYKIPF